MRRKPGGLVPLELAICERALDLARQRTTAFHGYDIAKRLAHATDTRLLTAYGTLYRALARLEQMGLVRSQWEAPEIAATERRPGRRLYTLTALGVEAAEQAAKAATNRPTTSRRRRWQPA
jgi:DNA-binding PadR family transcriptional regulator